jgi:hypothetical protein
MDKKQILLFYFKMGHKVVFKSFMIFLMFYPILMQIIFLIRLY